MCNVVHTLHVQHMIISVAINVVGNNSRKRYVVAIYEVIAIGRYIWQVLVDKQHAI